MHNYFETTVKFEKTAEEGKIVKVSEKYLVDALSFTEAEARIIQEITPFISGEFQVMAIKRKNYTEIVNQEWSINAVDAEANKIMGINKNQSTEADKWFECKVNYIVLDEEKGIERKTPVLMLVNANSVNSAHDTLIQCMKGSMADYSIEKVAETKIIEVFKYVTE
jgi:hypothetical protein